MFMFTITKATMYTVQYLKNYLNLTNPQPRNDMPFQYHIHL